MNYAGYTTFKAEHNEGVLTVTFDFPPVNVLHRLDRRCRCSASAYSSWLSLWSQSSVDTFKSVGKGGHESRRSKLAIQPGQNYRLEIRKAGYLDQQCRYFQRRDRSRLIRLKSDPINFQRKSTRVAIIKQKSDPLYERKIHWRTLK